MKSFYEILEIPESATTEQIRTAYLRLAREYHPDRVPEHLSKLRADAEDKFKEIQRAWSVLGDPAKRGQYDRIRRTSGIPTPRGPVARDSQKRPDDSWNTPTSDFVAPRKRIHDLLQRNHDVVKWSLLVVITTLVLVVIGEVIVSHQSDAAPVSRQGPPPAIVPAINLPPRHIRTWRAAGTGLEVQLQSVASSSNELELTFRIKAGSHADLLLYEPPGGNGLTKRILGKEVVVDREMGEIYLEDSSGTDYVSTTGFMGGEQSNFNLYNFTRRISFKAHEEVVLSAKFPPVSRGTRSLTFVSPALSKWQPEWRWPDIALK